MEGGGWDMAEGGGSVKLGEIRTADTLEIAGVQTKRSTKEYLQQEVLLFMKKKSSQKYF